MEAHYREVSTLDASETHRRISRAEDDDPGLLPYKKILCNGEDPRRKIAQQLVTSIAIARNLLEHGTATLELASELVEIERLNAKANWLLIDGHLTRGLTILRGAQQGNYKVHGSPCERKIRDQLLRERYLAMRKHRKMSKRSARIAVGRERGTSESTVKRALKRLGITD